MKSPRTRNSTIIIIPSSLIIFSSFAAAADAAPADTAASTPPSTLTVGMRLDNFLASAGSFVDVTTSLSSPQLYALIVGLTVLVSFLLLGSPTEMSAVEDVRNDGSNSNKNGRKRRSAPSRAKNISSSDSNNNNNNGGNTDDVDDIGPEPRWHLFRYFNYAIATAFAWSVAEFCLHATEYYYYNTDALLMFLLGWSVFLCYFFGFFGVSFVHGYASLGASEEDEDDEGGCDGGEEEDEAASRQDG